MRVSLVCFGSAPALEGGRWLHGHPVATIHADLTGGETGSGLARAWPLPANAGWSYFGLCLAGPFKVPTATEVVPGYPDRIIPKPGKEKELKAQTLTNLYNQRLPWLDRAHKALDAAVAAAYGWEDYTPEMPDEEILSRLLALNLALSSGPH